MKMLRRTISIMIAAMTLFSSAVPAMAFNSNESRSIENFFIEAKLLKGNGTSYEMEKTTTRIEGIVILIRLLGKEEEAQQMKALPCRFSDVPAWAAGYANYADSYNISKGVSTNSFGTNAPMTAQQFNTLLLRVIGYDDSQGDFQWSTAVDKAHELDILPDDMAYVYGTGAPYTKKDLIATSFAYLEAKNKTAETTLIDRLIGAGTISENLADEYGLSVKKWYNLTTNGESGENFQFAIDGKQLSVTGNSTDQDKEWVAVLLKDKATNAEKWREIQQRGQNGTFDFKVSLKGLAEGEYYIDLYINDEKYHYYSSYILSSIVLKIKDDDCYFPASPAYGSNLRIYKGNQLEAQDSRMNVLTGANKEASAEITDLAAKITADCKSDYEKIKAIHDWVSANLYYDKDYFGGKTRTTNIYTDAVLESRYAVCSGYANLTKDLISAAGIPCKQIFGFALDTSAGEGWKNVDLSDAAPNHVWNEAYVNGRWVVIDTTWDSSNRYEGGKFTEGERVSELYFDPTIPFFSETHKATSLDIQ